MELLSQIRRYKDLGGPGRGLFKLIKERKPDKLVIDLRQNLGGDYFHGLKHEVHPIRDLRAINKRGHLCVLIGVNTFSAAMANTAHFRYQTYVILVGQPIGEKPNSYPETGEFTLRNCTEPSATRPSTTSLFRAVDRVLHKTERRIGRRLPPSNLLHRLGARWHNKATTSGLAGAGSFGVKTRLGASN